MTLIRLTLWKPEISTGSNGALGSENNLKVLALFPMNQILLCSSLILPSGVRVQGRGKIVHNCNIDKLLSSVNHMEYRINISGAARGAHLRRG